MVERHNIAARADESSERSAEEIRHDIAERREAITETVEKLNDRVQETLDWRSYVTEHPLAAIGLAAGAGFVISGLFKRRPTPRDRILDAVAESVEDIRDRLRSSLDMLPVKAVTSKRTIKAALTALATKAVADYAKKELGNVLGRYRGQSTEESIAVAESGNYQNEHSRLDAAQASQSRR